MCIYICIYIYTKPSRRSIRARPTRARPARALGGPTGPAFSAFGMSLFELSTTVAGGALRHLAFPACASLYIHSCTVICVSVYGLVEVWVGGFGVRVCLLMCALCALCVCDYTCVCVCA